MKALAHIIVSAVAVYATARILPGVHISGFGTAVVVAVILGIVNAFLAPLLLILTLPINVVSLGLFTFVIIGALVKLVSGVVPGFHVDGFLWAIVFGLVLAVINAFLHSLR